MKKSDEWYTTYDMMKLLNVTRSYLEIHIYKGNIIMNHNEGVRYKNQPRKWLKKMVDEWKINIWDKRS